MSKKSEKNLKFQNHQKWSNKFWDSSRFFWSFWNFWKIKIFDFEKNILEKVFFIIFLTSRILMFYTSLERAWLELSNVENCFEWIHLDKKLLAYLKYTVPPSLLSPWHPIIDKKCTQNAQVTKIHLSDLGSSWKKIGWYLDQFPRCNTKK